MIFRRILVIGVSAILSCVIAIAAPVGGDEIKYADPDTHFHPQGKPPSEHTLATIKNARESMPFSDTRGFVEARTGFIAPLNSTIVEADAGHVAWDVGRYDFLNPYAVAEDSIQVSGE